MSQTAEALEWDALLSHGTSPMNRIRVRNPAIKGTIIFGSNRLGGILNSTGTPIKGVLHT
jgi:hypothetical protein